MSISNISYTGSGAGIVHGYPYTDFHEMNLDWILTNYKAILDKLNETINWANNHQMEYEEAYRRLVIVENELATFEASVTARFNSLEAELRADFEQLDTDIHNELTQTQIEIRQEVADTLAEFTNAFNDLKNSVQSDIINMEVEVKQAIVTLQNSITANNDYIMNQVMMRLQEFIDNLPDYENLIVYNPVSGAQTNVQQAIIDLYDCFRIYGLTASQYDYLQLTAAAYDAKNLTALEYDRWSYKLLDYPDPDHYMRSPFSGQIVKNKVVIYQLSELHRQALTAAEYDALELTAQQYNGYDLTAYVYDFYGVVLFGSALTAIEYDNKQLLAAYYDSLRLDAFDYDMYGKILIA